MVGRALAQVFSNRWYVLLAATIALATFVLTTWLGNLGLVWQIATSEWLPLADKARILVALIGSIGTNFTIFSASTAIGIAVLFGLNVATITFAYRKRRRLARQSGQTLTVASLGGLASGLFGIGCAACGTFVLSPALAFLGIGTFAALMPFGGEELGALGVGMLSLSLVMCAKKIGQPMMCRVSAETELPIQTTKRVHSVSIDTPYHRSPDGGPDDRLSSELASNPTNV
jgi:hypothetical protein